MKLEQADEDRKSWEFHKNLEDKLSRLENKISEQNDNFKRICDIFEEKSETVDNTILGGGVIARFLKQTEYLKEQICRNVKDNASLMKGNLKTGKEARKKLTKN